MTTKLRPASPTDVNDRGQLCDFHARHSDRTHRMIRNAQSRSAQRCLAIIGGSSTSIIFVATNTRDKDVFVATKHVFCRDKNMLVATNFLSRQNYVCRDKDVFVVTKLLSRQIFVATNMLLSRQAYFCRDKRRALSRRK